MSHHMRAGVSAAVFLLLAFNFLLAQFPQHQAENNGPQSIASIIAKGIYPCDGTLRRLPTDLVKREYRGQCFDGIEIWSQAEMLPGIGKAKSSLLIIAVNRRTELSSIVASDFYLGSEDPKHPNDLGRVKIINAIDPNTMSNWVSGLLDSSSVARFEEMIFRGGAISSGGSLMGIVYFGKFKGVHPTLIYAPKSWVAKGNEIEIPLGLGDWPDDGQNQKH